MRLLLVRIIIILLYLSFIQNLHHFAIHNTCLLIFNSICSVLLCSLILLYLPHFAPFHFISLPYFYPSKNTNSTPTLGLLALLAGPPEPQIAVVVYEAADATTSELGVTLASIREQDFPAQQTLILVQNATEEQRAFCEGPNG